MDIRADRGRVRMTEELRDLLGVPAADEEPGGGGMAEGMEPRPTSDSTASAVGLRTRAMTLLGSILPPR